VCRHFRQAALFFYALFPVWVGNGGDSRSDGSRAGRPLRGFSRARSPWREPPRTRGTCFNCKIRRLESAKRDSRPHACGCYPPAGNCRQCAKV